MDGWMDWECGGVTGRHRAYWEGVRVVMNGSLMSAINVLLTHVSTVADTIVRWQLFMSIRKAQLACDLDEVSARCQRRTDDPCAGLHRD